MDSDLAEWPDETEVSPIESDPTREERQAKPYAYAYSRHERGRTNLPSAQIKKLSFRSYYGHPASSGRPLLNARREGKNGPTCNMTGPAFPPPLAVYVYIERASCEA